MAEAKPVQPSADRTTMHRYAMNRGHLHHDLIQRQVALDRQPRAQPVVAGRKLAHGTVALRPQRKRPGLSLQDHKIVDEFRRHKEVPPSLAVPMTRLDKGDDPTTKFNRMRFFHS